VDLSEPALSVIPGVTGSVLAALARSNEPLTGRTVAERAKPLASQKGVALVLTHLVDAGVVDRVDKGRSGLFSLNREHLAAAAIVAIATLRERCLADMRSTLTSWKPKAVSATVFGSFARGDGTTTSDIDLLLVAPSNPSRRWSEQVLELTAAVGRWTGNPLNVIQIAGDDLGAYAQEAFVGSAIQEGITVSGTTLRQALRKRAVVR
jgi:predicted nucleotidyltransferase